MKALMGRILGPLMLAAALPLAAPLAAQDTILPDDEELTSFTHAYIDIQDIRAEVEVRMLQASSEEEATAVQQEANERMQAALDEQEITVDRYTEITNVLNADEPLRVRFQEIYEEIIEERDPGM